jgi:hypothetical protein
MADKPTKAELAKLPGGADFDVDNASEEDYQKHIGLLRRRKEVADATVVAPAAAAAPAGQAAPATFTAPSAPLVGYHDSLTGLVQQLPQKLYDVLSDEDKERLTPATDKPEPLKTNG